MTAGAFVDVVRSALSGALLLFMGLGCNAILGNEDPEHRITNGSTISATGGAPISCEPTDPVCTQVDSECIALVDNNGAKKAGLRVAQLTTTKPEVLSTGTIADGVGVGVQMNLDTCNLFGTGTFSWLLEVDTETGMIKMGGALPAVNPVDGYCFVNKTLSSNPVKPVTFDSGLTGDGNFSATTGVDVTLPIYATMDAKEYTLIPLHQVRLEGKLSKDHNCIGKYNADALLPADGCKATSPDQLTFTTAGKADSFIVLAEADGVIVKDGNQSLSLCVVLSGNAFMYGDGGIETVHCKRTDNVIDYKGDWCSTTNKEADANCSDAVHMTSEFAASAVKITGDCQ